MNASRHRTKGARRFARAVDSWVTAGWDATMGCMRSTEVAGSKHAELCLGRRVRRLARHLFPRAVVSVTTHPDGQSDS